MCLLWRAMKYDANLIDSVPCTSSARFNSTFLDGATYYRVSQSNNHNTSIFCHLNVNTKFKRAWNCNYKEIFESHSDHQRKIQYPVNHQSPLFIKSKGRPEKINYRNTSTPNTWFISRQSRWLKQLYSNIPIDGLVKLAICSTSSVSYYST